ncbi:hypothetical protein TWF730_002741 [Orbilia blumenaviensis]|uniref:Uncharacterized protein n=1 Tax=Orbilia blumenaviensis TaxID=1796055 RepID=A0AAV9U7N7_9PEZI
MTDTQKTEEWEGPPLDQGGEEEHPDNTQPESTPSTGGEGTADAVTKNDSHDDDETSTSRTPKVDPEANKENIGGGNDQAGKKLGGENSTQATKDQSENSTVRRGRSRSRPTRRLSAKPSKMGNEQGDDGNASTTAVSSPEKQSLPAVYEDKDAANKGQLVKRNRRRNKKSGYESSATDEMPLRERQYPPQQQMQMQQQPAPGKKSDAIKLRLDLNLEVEVELKARIHGDLTLSLF